MNEPSFITVKDILFIHEQEIQACADAPKASYGGEYLNNLFEMAASYIVCLTIRHPFVDGNKRTALASALTFLYLNGYEVEESYGLELADLVLDFLSKDVLKEDIAKHLKENATKR